MATRKKTTAPKVDTEVKTEAVIAESEPAAKKTAAAKKTTAAKKTAAAKKTTAAEKTAAAKKTTAAEKTTAAKTTTTVAKTDEVPEAPKTEVFIEYGGAQVSVDEIVRNAKMIVGNDKDIKIYVQPNTSKAYISFGEETVSMDVFFC